MMLHLLNFPWPGGERGRQEITISFKYFKEPSLTCLASQSLFLHCHYQEVFTLRFQRWFIIEQSSLWFGGESKSHRNLFCCHFCFPTLQMTVEATDGRQSSSKKLSSHFGHAVMFWCLSASIILLLTYSSKIIAQKGFCFVFNLNVSVAIGIFKLEA